MKGMDGFSLPASPPCTIRHPEAADQAPLLAQVQSVQAQIADQLHEKEAIR